MAGTWHGTERSQTGETQYIIARLEQDDGDPQVLNNNTSTPINVSGYTGGNFSLKTSGGPILLTATIIIMASIDGINFFSLDNIGILPLPPISASTTYSVRWGGLPLKLVQLKISGFSTSTVDYVTLVTNA